MHYPYQDDFQKMLENWNQMQKTSDDEGAEWAERFEHSFYEFIQSLEEGFNTIKPILTSIEEAENHPVIQPMLKQLPDPLYLPFINELERIIDGRDYELSD